MKQEILVVILEARDFSHVRFTINIISEDDFDNMDVEVEEIN